MYTSFSKSMAGSRNVSANKSEGRYLEPSQLKLQATGNTVVERSKDFVRPALDFRLTKDTGVVRSVGDRVLSPSSFHANITSARRANSGDVQHFSTAGYAPVVNPESGSNTYSEADVLEDPSANRSRHIRSSSASVMNSSTAGGFSRTAVDKVMIAESSGAPGVPIIYRAAEERAANPDRLNLDRRRLVVCPILDGEDQLRLLNYQHNNIRKISNLQTLRKLIFLDLYDNQIEEISGISNLRSLRVLMLGKNRIKKIEHLDSLVKLDVLDLHGNEIQVIENINHLVELRVLNLAGNRISFVDNLTGMLSLAELNLRRNQIYSLTGVDQLPSLQRLFLSCNEITSFEDIKCLSKSHSLQEIALDGNPIASDQYYKQNILSSMQQIRQLDMKRVTDEEKRISAVMVRKEEDRRRELQKISIMKEKRKQAINTAKEQWELMQSTLMGKSNRLTKMPEIYAKHISTYDNVTTNQSPVTAASTTAVVDDDSLDEASGTVFDSEDLGKVYQDPPPQAHLSRGAHNYNRVPVKIRSHSESRPMHPSTGTRPDFHDRGNGLAELDGDTLTCYGPGSVESLDKNWGIQAAGAVTNIVFKFIEYGDIVSKAFNKIRSKFPSANTYEFMANNIHSLQQINALSQIRKIESLTICEEGNPVTQISVWKHYTLFRLSHMSIKSLNGKEVTAEDIVMAEKLFGAVSQKAAEYLPNFRLLSLLPETRKKQVLAEEKSKNSNTICAQEDSKAYGSESSARALLSYSTIEQALQAQIDYTAKKRLAREMVQSIAKSTSAVDQVTAKLNNSWEKSFTKRVQAMCVEMLSSENYSKLKMDNYQVLEHT